MADVLPASNSRGSGTPHVGNCQTSISSGIFKIQGLPRRATSECVISTLAARGAPRTEAEAAHRLWCPAGCLGDRVGRATPYSKFGGSSDAAEENLRIRGFRYQSSRSHRYLSVELSPIHGQHMGITAPSAKPSNCFAARMFRDSVGKNAHGFRIRSLGSRPDRGPRP